MYLTNKQEIFNEVYTKLVKQGQPSSENGLCRYRGPEGARCAVGWLIPDEDYHESFECLGVGTLLEELESSRLKSFLENHRELLMDLQQAHDSAIPSEDYEDDPDFPLPKPWLQTWKEEMEQIAQRHKLTIPNIG